MNVFEINSAATKASKGLAAGTRTILSWRQNPESVARNETTQAERSVRVCVTARTGKRKGEFWQGTPSA